MAVALIAALLLVLASVLILYETLRLTSIHLINLRLPLYVQVMVVACAIFAGHLASVLLYGIAYWVLLIKLGIEGFSGVPVTDFAGCLYFSIVAYTSLGFGDHFPTSHMRIIAGIEGLNGLLAIGWSASFTYLVMQRYWPMHEKRGRKSRGR